MSRFKPGQRSERLGVTLETPVAEEPWGEIWRGEHAEHGRVFLVAYRHSSGKRAFRKALPALNRWRELTALQVPGLLALHDINDDAGKLPVLAIEDPGGRTAREFFTEEKKVVKNAARLAASCARALEGAEAHGIGPIGLSPDTIVGDAASFAHPWRLMPVTPGSFESIAQLGGGLYAPPRTKGAPDPRTLNADAYALYWIWIECLARHFGLIRDPEGLAGVVRHPRLRGLIESGLAFASAGPAEPKQIYMAAEQWLDSDAAADQEDLQNAERDGVQPDLRSIRPKERARRRNGSEPAPFGRRAAAAAIDLALAAALGVPVGLGLASLNFAGRINFLATALGDPTIAMLVAGTASVIPLGGLFEVFGSASAGKMLLGLCILDRDGERAGAARRLGRYALKHAGVAVLLAGAFVSSGALDVAGLTLIAGATAGTAGALGGSRRGLLDRLTGTGVFGRPDPRVVSAPLEMDEAFEEAEGSSPF